jgi:hypothetical protein
MNKKLQKFAEFCRILQNFRRQILCVCVGGLEKTFQNRNLIFYQLYLKFLLFFFQYLFDFIIN